MKHDRNIKRIGCSYIKIGFSDNSFIFYSIAMDQNAMSFWGLGTWGIVLILFLFFMNNGNGFGWFWGNNAAWLLNGMNNNNNHDNTVDIINNNSFWSQQLAAQQNLANQTTLITQGFCNTNNNIEKAILAGQQNTAAIIAASTSNTQKILDKLCADETARLRSELLEARNSQSNSLQTQYLISQLRPYPTPSYQVSSPYESITPAAWA